MGSGFLQQRNDLLALHARKAFKKLLDRISPFQVIEEALRGDARACEYRLAAEHFRILRHDAAHSERLTSNDGNASKPSTGLRPSSLKARPLLRIRYILLTFYRRGPAA